MIFSGSWKDRAIATAARTLLQLLKSRFEETSVTWDDDVYNTLRDWALQYGLIDDGGPDDPGPIGGPMEDGGGGGPG